MPQNFRSLLLVLCSLLCVPGQLLAAAPVDLNTPREFPAISSRADWEKRAQQIREQVLVSCGLWPMPEKTPLKPRIFGRIERDGYSVEKVYFQTAPGFYLAGNLYRPVGRGKGPFPAVLNPHGHWKEGRMADNKDGSIAGRCINFARQGMIAFSYDMLGYNDTFFPDYGEVPVDKFYIRHRRFATNQVCLLWNISQMGLQTWNSVRALDFLESLPDVDRKRLACTGESGGGTQTFMLGAIDDRLIAQAPIVMVSHSMQGGCSCENAPGLRVDFSNMEIAAAAVPRPQILVAATGDWTRATLTVEGPAIGRIYELFKASDRFRFVRFDYNHNYNQTSREAVYGWFQQWVLGKAAAAEVRETAFQKEPDADLRVWPDSKLPSDAVSEEQFVNALIEDHRRRWKALLPRNRKTLEAFKTQTLPAWQRTLQVHWPDMQNELSWKAAQNGSDFRCAQLSIKRPGSDSNLTALYWTPAQGREARPFQRILILAEPDGRGGAADETGKPGGLTATLIEQGHAVLAVKNYSTSSADNPFANFFTTYNRTALQQRVGDLIALCAQARSLAGGKNGRAQVVLWGVGKAGLWSLLAAPAADVVLADADQFDPHNDAALLAADFFCPGIRNIGVFEGAAMLAAPHPLLLYNRSPTFSTASLEAAYKAAGGSRKFRHETAALSSEELIQWLSSQN